MITITSAEAKDQIGELLDGLENGPVTIVREGKPAALLVSADEIREFFEDQNRRKKTVAAYEAWSERVRKTMTPAAAELTDEEVNRLIHELR